MIKIKNRHWNRRGETLVEILVAVLIIALSAVLFATMYSASMNINLAAQRQDKLFYEAMEQLEEMMGKHGDATVVYHPTGVEGEAYDSEMKVEFFTQDGMSAYRTQDGMSAYREKTSAAPAPGTGGTP